MCWMEDSCSLYALVHCAPAHLFLVMSALAAATAWLCSMQQAYNILALCNVVGNTVIYTVMNNPGFVVSFGWLPRAACTVVISLFLCTCRYVVVESDGTTAASWQRGANNVLALQMNDEEVEVYDNWWVVSAAY